MTEPTSGDPDAWPAREPSIDEYIAANRDRFTPGALRERLRSAGHDADAVEIALAAAFAPPSARTAAPTEPSSPVPASNAAVPATPIAVIAPDPHTIRKALSGSRYGTRGRIGATVIRVAHVVAFFVIAWWYVGRMSGIGAVIAGVLLAFGLGIGFMVSMTAFNESSPKLLRGNVLAGVAAGIAAPLLVMIVLTGVCVGVSLPVDWLTRGL